VLVDDRADREPNRGGIMFGWLPGNRSSDALELTLRRLQQRLALSRLFRGQRRIAAGDETLAREVRRGDLSEIALVEDTSATVLGPRRAWRFVAP